MYDDALAAIYARLLHLHVWATLRCLQYRSGEYIVIYVCNFGLIMTRKALYFVIGFATIWQIMYTLTNSIAVAADPQATTPVFDGQRDSFVGWYMLFTGYVAWKATDAYTTLYPRAILVEPNLCSCFGSNLLQLSERDAAPA